MEHHFYLKEQLKDKLRLFRLEYLADSFPKMNKVSLSLQGKQRKAFAANDKMQTFKQKLESGTLISVTMNLMSSQCLKTPVKRLTVI